MTRPPVEPGEGREPAEHEPTEHELTERRQAERERAEEIAVLLRRWELGAVHRLRAVAERAGLSLNAYLALAELCVRPDGLHGAALAGIVGIGSGGASGVLTGLERQGLVDRDVDPFDGRQVLWSATGAGRALVRDDVVDMGGPGLAAIVRGMSPERVRTVATFVGLVVDRAYRQARSLRELLWRR